VAETEKKKYPSKQREYVAAYMREYRRRQRTKRAEKANSKSRLRAFLEKLRLRKKKLERDAYATW